MKIEYFFLPLVLLLSACASTTMAPETKAPTLDGDKPIVIAHRGASGYLPEHTLAAYALAIDMGADFIEPDLVATKDGVLVARHENEFSGTSDVATRFPERKKTKTIDGTSLTGWFTEDFTLAELKTIRARERLSFRSQTENGKHEIPTFAEILALVRREEKKRGRKIGVYPELKHAAYFESIGIALAPLLLTELAEAKFSPNQDRVFIQSFEPEILQWLAARSKWRLVLLILKGDSRFDPFSDEKLREVRAYASGIGPDKRMIIPESFWGGLGKPTDLVARAHRAGLTVHPYTFRSDKEFLDSEYKGSPEREYFDYFKLGVDGVFSDFADQAIAARKQFFSR